MFPKSKIFIASNDASDLIPVDETEYSAEIVLQTILARNPDLIPGDQINPEDPRRWLLVCNEAGIPSEENGSNYWRIDHIFIDHEGIPTLIECKRSSDPRLRREVVAQLLEYAANATEYWPNGTLKNLFKQAHANNSEIYLKNFLEQRLKPEGETYGIELINDFWTTVDTNIANCKIRLLFVADRITKELRRLVEFLNTQMATIEVLAVEIKQYTNKSNKLKTYVSRIIGQTENTQQRKTTPKKKFASIEMQLETFPQNAIFKDLVKISKENKHTTQTGITNFSIRKTIGNKAVVYAIAKPDAPSLHITTEYMNDFPELITQIENLLESRGLFRTGKRTTILPINNNKDEVCDHLRAVIGLINSYAARFDSQ